MRLLVSTGARGPPYFYRVRLYMVIMSTARIARMCEALSQYGESHLGIHPVFTLRVGKVSDVL